MSKYKVTTDRGSYIVTVDDAAPGPAKSPLPLGLTPNASFMETMTNAPHPLSTADRYSMSEEIPKGLIDLAGGHLVKGALETLTPGVLAGASALGLRTAPEAGMAAPKIVRGALKGGTQAFIEGKSSIPAATGALIGHSIHGPQGAEIGAGIGALPGTLQGIIRGIRSEFMPPASERPNMPAPPVKFRAQSQTPIVSPPPVSFRPGPTPVAPPPVTFPAGPEASAPWAAPPVSFRQPPPPGKVVPPPPVRFKPVEEGDYPPITIEGIGPVKPLGPPPNPTEESPFMTNENLMPIDKVELNRMLHAKAQRLNLPNSPAGQRAPGLMSSEAQKVFGKSYDQLTVPELKQLYTHLDTLQVK